MAEMRNGASPSFLDDLIYACKSVGKTLLSIVLLALALIVGLVLVGIVLIITAVLWLGHRVRVIKQPPSVKFGRFQGKALTKFIQSRMAKSGFVGFPGSGASGPRGASGRGFPGQQQPTAENATPADVEQNRSLEQEYRKATAQVELGKNVTSGDSPDSSTSEPVEVDAEAVQDNLEGFHGSLDEFMRLKDRRP